MKNFSLSQLQLPVTSYGCTISAHSAALVPPYVRHELSLHSANSELYVSTLIVGVTVEEDPSLVERREYVADPQVEGLKLVGEVGPAPGERPGAKRAAGVDAAQDVKEQIVGEGT